MEEMFKYLLSVAAFLCVVTATEDSSDSYISDINEKQHQWKADHNFDSKTEYSILHSPSSKVEEPLTAGPSGRGLFSAIADFLKPKLHITVKKDWGDRSRKVLLDIGSDTNTGSGTNMDSGTGEYTGTGTGADSGAGVDSGTGVDSDSGVDSGTTATNIRVALCPALDENDSCYDEDLPSQFDAREYWPLCSDTISKILESSLPNDCSIDWATSVVGSIQDRYCIHNSVGNRTFSVGQIVECCPFCKDICHGSAAEAYEYFKKYGVPSGAQIVSGGGQGAGLGCRPYSSATITTENYCPRECKNELYTISFEQDLVKIADYCKPQLKLKVDATLTASYRTDVIKQEIEQHGPVTATINFYRDLLYYREGVYAPLEDVELMGKITVKVIGWGFEKGKAYWLVSNIWKQGWGDKGFGKLEAWNPKLELETNIIVARI